MTNPLAAHFGKNLREHRKRLDISQEELGFLADVHRTEVGELERGARVPQLDTIIKLAGGLALAPSELLDGLSWAEGAFYVDEAAAQ